MQLRILLKRAAVFAGTILSLAILFCLANESSIRNGSAMLIGSPITSFKQEQASFGLPVRLKIPVIDIDTAIEYVGLTADGAMDTPESSDNVAWFMLGPLPGKIGSAVIAGHYGPKNGKASVFDDLYKLRQGDKLHIEDDRGATIIFVVQESRIYDPAADASDVFSSADGRSHLNLITCEGVWDAGSSSYSERLVVFTDKE